MDFLITEKENKTTEEKAETIRDIINRKKMENETIRDIINRKKEGEKNELFNSR